MGDAPRGRAASAAATTGGFGRIALTAATLGLLAGAHAVVLVAAPSILARRWAGYVVGMCTFHFLEFMWADRYSPATVSWDAFLLNHSPQYHVAVAAGVAEFALGAALAPGAKAGAPAIAAVGAALVIAGQAVRAAAMWHAGGNFTHLVAEERREGHVLVTTGVYATLRHPAYTGWFWWSVGTQLLLVNPLCALAYAAAASRFFDERIRHEEERLVDFFGEQYRRYAARTWVAIPRWPAG